MLYTIAEISKLTDLSKVSIYKKLKLKELPEHVSKKQGVTYVDEVVLTFIQDSLKVNSIQENDSKQGNNSDTSKSEIAMDIDTLNLKTDYINALKDNIETLKKQLDIKDEQIRAKDNQIEGLTTGLHQAQALTNNQQQGQQNILLLEQHQQEFDNKLNNLMEQLHEREHPSGEQIKKPGLFNKIFGK